MTGTITFADVDLTDRPVVSAAISATDPFRYYDAQGNDITATLTPAQLAAILAVEVPLSVMQNAGNTHNGSANWTYSVEDSKFDFLADGETLTLNYVASVDDGHGGVVSTVDHGHHQGRRRRRGRHQRRADCRRPQAMPSWSFRTRPGPACFARRPAPSPLPTSTSPTGRW